LLPQYQKRVYFLCIQIERVANPEAAPDDELFDQRRALSANERLRTFFGVHLAAAPNNARLYPQLARDKAASPFSFQSVTPAGVAIPSGLVGELEMKCDD